MGLIFWAQRRVWRWNLLLRWKEKCRKFSLALPTIFCWDAYLYFFEPKGGCEAQNLVLGGKTKWHGWYWPCHFSFPPNIGNFLQHDWRKHLLGCGPSIFFSPRGSVKVKLGWEGRKNGMVDTGHGILSSLPTLEFPPRLPTLFCWDIGLTLMVSKGSLEGRFGMVVGNCNISPSIPTLEISPSTFATILLRNLYLTIYLPLFWFKNSLKNSLW